MLKKVNCYDSRNNEGVIEFELNNFCKIWKKYRAESKNEGYKESLIFHF